MNVRQVLMKYYHQEDYTQESHEGTSHLQGCYNTHQQEHDAISTKKFGAWHSNPAISI